MQDDVATSRGVCGVLLIFIINLQHRHSSKHRRGGIHGEDALEAELVERHQRASRYHAAHAAALHDQPQLGAGPCVLRGGCQRAHAATPTALPDDPPALPRQVVYICAVRMGVHRSYSQG